MNLRDFMYKQARPMALCLILSLILAATSQAQPAPAFDVATVKPSATKTRRFSIQNGRVSIGYYTLSDLILDAYQAQFYDLVIPNELKWAKESRFDIEAQGPATTTNAEIRLMLRTLLADRFSLKIREEPREMPVFALLVARADRKLGKGMVEVTGKPCEKPQNPLPNQPRCGNGWQPHLNVISFTVSIKAGTIAQLSARLSIPSLTGLTRRVIDQTKLTGEYNIDFDFTQQLYELAPASLAETADAPPLQTALSERLGLKLEATKASYPVLVVESATKPGDN